MLFNILSNGPVYVPLKDCWVVFCHFIHILIANSKHSATSDMGLNYLPMSHKMGAMHIWVIFI